MYECEYCDASFDNFYSLRSHVNGSDKLTREGIPGCARRVNAGGDQHNSSAESDVVDCEGAVPIITTPVDMRSVSE